MKPEANEMTVRLLAGLTREEFYKRTNGRCRERTFSDRAWPAFCRAYTRALRAIRRGKPYWREGSAGYIKARSYQYPATTARWGVWVSWETWRIVWEVDRARANSTVAYCCPGGRRSYLAAWKKYRKNSLAYSRRTW